eukprot:TRINITY_DN1935_c0_g2_i2.p1 TRINITY_DN1935_c0_g2~~TRINITY_DN1935_c0_g2_i2.p1  ORF type:complete len:352 (+),score=99.19 TRINITY_DN1935_c0_g2_i2:162-1217(+)
MSSESSNFMEEFEKDKNGSNPRFLNFVSSVGISIPRVGLKTIKVGSSTLSHDNVKDEFISVCLLKNMICVSIFDGHGGEHVSKYLNTFLPTLILKNFESEGVSPKKDPQFVIQFLQKIFIFTNNSIKNNLGVLASTCGSTCAIVLIVEDTIYCSNLGNTKILFSTGEVSKFHNLDDYDEYMRCINKNSHVYGNRLNGALSVTRSFGDFEIPGVICLPHIYHSLFPFNRYDDSVRSDDLIFKSEDSMKGDSNKSEEHSIETKYNVYSSLKPKSEDFDQKSEEYLKEKKDRIQFIILSSNGFHKYVSDDLAIRITRNVLLFERNPQKAAKILKSTAIINGSDDSISVTVIYLS